MKKTFKQLASVIIALAVVLSVPVARADVIVNNWSKIATNSIATNSGNGLANAEIHVAQCYIGLGTGTPCGAGGGVSSLNTLTGALTLAAGTGISITPSGGNILTITNTGGVDSLWQIGGGVDSLMDKRSTSSNGDGSFTAGNNSTNSAVSGIVIGNNINVTHNFVIAIGESALNNSTGIGGVAIGQHAGDGNTGNTLLALNDGAADGNSGDHVTALGEFSAINNTGDNVIAVGYAVGGFRAAASGNTGNDVLALGAGAAFNNTHNNVILLGTDAVASAINEFGISPSIDHVKFPLNAHSSGAVLTSNGIGVATWQNPTLPSLANTDIWIGNGSNVAIPNAVSGDASLSNTGVLTLVGSVRVITQRISLTSGQILALNGTPITLISAPGTGKAIDLLSASARLTYGTTTYAANTALHIRMNTAGSDYLANNSNVLGHASNAFGTFDLAEGVNNIIENKAVEVFVSGGNPTTGDGTLDIYVTYKITTL